MPLAEEGGGIVIVIHISNQVHILDREWIYKSLRVELQKDYRLLLLGTEKWTSLF